MNVIKMTISALTVATLALGFNASAAKIRCKPSDERTQCDTLTDHKARKHCLITKAGCVMGPDSAGAPDSSETVEEEVTE